MAKKKDKIDDLSVSDQVPSSNPEKGDLPDSGETSEPSTPESVISEETTSSPSTGKKPKKGALDSKTNAAPSDGPASYQVVARRYRPQEFDQLIGQDHIAKALIGAIKTGRVGHAYLFTGARGVGKTSSARILAKALNCVHGPTPTPCNECEICRAISAGDDIDVLEIDGASNRGIDEIRQLRQSATIRPSRARYKIYIIDEVHMLTREAFNALLKTLEEPPEHVKFIFCTTEPTKLPITILSRCQRFDFAGINTRTIAQHLEYIAQNEGITVEEGVCETLARRANGSMRDAQSLLEQLLSFAPSHIRLSDVHGMLGTVDDQKIFDLLTAIRNEAPGDLFPLLNRAADDGVDFGILLEQMTGTLRDLLTIACGCGPETMIYTGLGRFDEMKDLAATFGPERILASLQILSQTISRMRYSTQGRILSEMALVRLCGLGHLRDLAGLIDLLKSGRFPQAGISLPTSDPRGGRVPPLPPSPQKKTTDSAPITNHSAPSRTPSLTGPNRPEAAAPSPVSESSRPPQSEGVPESSDAPPKIQLGPLSDAERLEVWRRAVDPLGVALAASAQGLQSLAWDPPHLKIGFEPGKSFAMNHCHQESGKILEALRKIVADPIQLDFFLTEAPPSATEKPKHPVSSTADRFNAMRKKIDHPMVKAAEKYFHAELSEVRDEKKNGTR